MALDSFFNLKPSIIAITFSFLASRVLSVHMNVCRAVAGTQNISNDLLELMFDIFKKKVKRSQRLY